MALRIMSYVIKHYDLKWWIGEFTSKTGQGKMLLRPYFWFVIFPYDVVRKSYRTILHLFMLANCCLLQPLTMLGSEVRIH